MIVIFVHGWSVQHTNTYGGLPRWLTGQTGPDGKPFEVGSVYLGRYVSFEDTVTVDDISRAFDQAITDELGARLKAGERFACITHSTGGPVLRNWIHLFYRNHLDQCPLTHLVMLAPANHGSALAQLGKGRLSRIKSFFQGVAPGQLVLNWLELGSEPQWALNEAWLGYDGVGQGLYPFVLTGQKIDRSLYDALNSYTDEMGSDGVVRVAGANLNYSLLRLAQGADAELAVKRVSRSKPTAFGVLPQRAHSGDDFGIIRSVTARNADAHPTAQWVVRCLQVTSEASYSKVRDELAEVTRQTQEDEKVDVQTSLFGTRTYPNDRCLQAVFRLVDDRGQELSNYDLFLTAGPNYSEQDLPPGFFIDRQRNQLNPGKLTYYLNLDVLEAGLARPELEGRLGFRVEARPKAGLAFYRQLDFRSTLAELKRVLIPNETMMVEIELKRMVDKAVFRITDNLTPAKFDDRPSGETVA